LHFLKSQLTGVAKLAFPFDIFPKNKPALFYKRAGLFFTLKEDYFTSLDKEILIGN